MLPHQYSPLLQVLSIQSHSGVAFGKARSWYLRGLPLFPQTKQTRDSLRLPATCLHGPLETQDCSALRRTYQLILSSSLDKSWGSPAPDPPKPPVFQFMGLLEGKCMGQSAVVEQADVAHPAFQPPRQKCSPRLALSLHLPSSFEFATTHVCQTACRRSTQSQTVDGQHIPRPQGLISRSRPRGPNLVV